MYTKLNTKTKQYKKHNTACVGRHYTQTNTNNINKTWALLQTTESKDESNIVFIPKSQWTSQHETENVKTHNWRKQKRGKTLTKKKRVKTFRTICFYSVKFYGKCRTRLKLFLLSQLH